MKSSAPPSIEGCKPTHPAFDLTAPRQTTNNRNPNRIKPFKGLRAATNHRGNITLTGAEQGAADAAKLQRTRGATR